MHTKNTCSFAAVLVLAACATTGGDAVPPGLPRSAPDLSTNSVAELPLTPNDPAMGLASLVGDTQQGRPARGRPTWRDGAALLTGYFGATVYDNIERTKGPVTATGDDVTIPSLGGGAQLKLAGDGLDLGLEGLLGFNWRASSTAFVVGGGGAAIAVDTDLVLFDLYGGPFASMFLGSGARVYVGAGPMMQWAFYEARGYGDGSGFGLGYYARTGFEFALGRGSLVGVGARWSQSEIDLDGGLGDLQVDGLMLTITFSHF